MLEVVVGVQFDPLPQLTSAQVGAFWRTVSAAWPKAMDQPPLALVTVPYGDDMWEMPSIQLRLTTPAPRVWMSRVEDDRLLQVQNGWFLANWRKTPQKPDYPRFEAVKADFDSGWRSFQGFLQNNGLGPPVPNVWEVTYVNRLPRGDLWKSPSDWPEMLPNLFGRVPMSPATSLEDMGVNVSYTLGDRAGRLVVTVQQVRTSSTGDVSLQMQLTARGAVIGATPEAALESGLDLGRKSIVEYFVASTTEPLHAIWHREA